jgi:hypothetical protein
MQGVIALLGGVRAAAFAAAALVFLLAAIGFGVAWQVQSSRLEACQAKSQGYAEAQKSNLTVIDDLNRRLNECVATHAANDEAAARAAEKLEAEKAKIAKELAETREELNDVYEKQPTARAWGRTGVDRAVADRLPGPD